MEYPLPMDPLSQPPMGHDGMDGEIAKREKEDEPPYSRVFIACGKNVTEDQLREWFAPEKGTLQYCKVSRDKLSGESRGIAFVKYSLASSAAAAIENLNGKDFGTGEPLRVEMAAQKGVRPMVSTAPEDNPPRSRLYVTCSKSMSEEELKGKFEPFGSLEYCKLVKDKATGESKGCAYVKYSMSSVAANALETINEQYAHNPDPHNDIRVVVAEPKAKRLQETQAAQFFQPYGNPRGGYGAPPNPYGAPPAPYGGAPGGYGGGGYGQGYPPMQGMMQQGGGGGHGGGNNTGRLYVVTSKSVTGDQLARLFQRIPGLEYVDLKKDRTTGESKGFGFANYSTQQAAAMAVEHFNGIDYPPGTGHPLKVVFAEAPGGQSSSSSSSGHHMPPMGGGGMGGPMGGHPGMSGGGMPGGMGGGMPPMDPSMMHQAPPSGFPAPSSASQSHPVSGGVSGGGSASDSNPEGSRLFVVVLGKNLPEYVLHDVFAQFGGLEYIKLTQGKNYGYVKYSTAFSAQYAMHYLNGAEINQGTRLKVVIAEQPGPAGSVRKK